MEESSDCGEISRRSCADRKPCTQLQSAAFTPKEYAYARGEDRESDSRPKTNRRERDTTLDKASLQGWIGSQWEHKDSMISSIGKENDGQGTTKAKKRDDNDKVPYL